MICESETATRLKVERNVEVDLLLETGGGGAGRHVLDLYRGLRRQGWNARLLVSSRRADEGFKAELATLPQHHLMYLDMRRSPHLSDLWVAAQLRRYLAGTGRMHLVHAHSTKAGLLGCALHRKGVKTVFTPHAYRGMDPMLGRPAALAVNRLEAAFTAPYDQVIAVSPEEKAYISSLGVAQKRISYIPNGVDPIDIRTRSACTARPATPVIGFVGRMVHQKNAALFLRAFAVLVKRGVTARALMIGEGPLRESLTLETKAAGIDHLIDWLGDAPAIENLGLMNVMVHTSFYESFPYTLLEAAAAAVPIVAVRNAGSRAVLGAHLPASVLVQQDPTRLAEAIETLLTNTEARREHLAALENVARHFTVEKMIQSTITVYENALAS